MSQQRVRGFYRFKQISNLSSRSWVICVTLEDNKDSAWFPTSDLCIPYIKLLANYVSMFNCSVNS